MSFYTYLAAWLAFAYLLGSIPSGYLIARAHRIDIRKIGSGNIGATNVQRALGWRWAGVVFVLDFLKGLLPLLLLTPCLASLPAGTIPTNSEPWVRMAIGIFAVLGHVFTPWLRFKGGKGMATGCGVVVGLYQLWILPILALFALIVWTTRYVSLGSLMSVALLLAMTFTVPQLRPYWLFAVLVALLVVYTHRSNIGRLAAGTENRIGRQPPPADDEPQ